MICPREVTFSNYTKTCHLIKGFNFYILNHNSYLKPINELIETFQKVFLVYIQNAVDDFVGHPTIRMRNMLFQHQLKLSNPYKDIENVQIETLFLSFVQIRIS